MTTAKADDATKIFAGSSKARAFGRAATLATVLGAVLGVASLINGWNWSETLVLAPYVAFEGGVAVFGLSRDGRRRGHPGRIREEEKPSYRFSGHGSTR